ncbi:P-loop containing nucleoside triphosphate hydrolase protein [Mycena vitilis]|nr:P-loop containing nucleoside triphosphate hydrolase protein [Mycena vitilis]
MPYVLDTVDDDELASPGTAGKRALLSTTAVDISLWYSRERDWIIQDSEVYTTPNRDTDQYTQWSDHVFIVQRNVKQSKGSDYPEIATELLIRSGYLRKALREVMKYTQGLDWTASLLTFDPNVLLAFLPRMGATASALCDTEAESSTTKKHLSFLIEFLESEYAALLSKIRNFIRHGEITFDLAWAIFIPGDVVFSSCRTTGEPRVFRLRKMETECHWFTREIFWSLSCEYVEAFEHPSTTGQQFGLATYQIEIECFEGVKKITDLQAYPVLYHADGDDIRQNLTRRARKWVKLCGVHHNQYNGLAWKKTDKKLESMPVNGRIIIDRGESPPSPRTGLLGEMCGVPHVFRESTRLRHGEHILKDDDLMLATPIVYGFSFTAKRWLEFNVEFVNDIKWNDEGFKNLAIDPDRKTLIQALVQSHANSKDSVDDFVVGKGLGLIINLFGPPGVGKTLTVEATSEHLRKPLYIVSAGELGTTPAELDRELTKIFSLIPVWDAVVLIDEADVFLQKRKTADVERNAMAAVFLRQLEYFQGILFLTTNRVKQFDPAFQSRIHLSLRYQNLSPSEKEQLWHAFLEKTRTVGLGLKDPSARQLRALAQRKLNGRQIKNVVKLAVALAGEEQKPLTYAHLVRTMSATDDWRPRQLGALLLYRGTFWAGFSSAFRRTVGFSE